MTRPPRATLAAAITGTLDVSKADRTRTIYTHRCMADIGEAEARGWSFVTWHSAGRGEPAVPMMRPPAALGESSMIPAPDYGAGADGGYTETTPDLVEDAADA